MTVPFHSVPGLISISFNWTNSLKNDKHLATRDFFLDTWSFTEKNAILPNTTRVKTPNFLKLGQIPQKYNKWLQILL